MAISIAHLGPPGTYTEAAAIACLDWLKQETGQDAILCPYPSIGQTLEAVASKEAQMAVVPMENSIEGSVTMTLDNLWQLDTLRIQRALVMPIFHALLSRAEDWEAIRVVYSHPQALAQCQKWLDNFLPKAQPIALNSTTEALQYLDGDPTIAAISSQQAAQLHHLPILACPINDYPDNCTRFLLLSLTPSPGGAYTSLAFSVGANQPGALVTPLQIFAKRSINLSRIESRPTKRSLGEYLFFIDLEADARGASMQSALVELADHTETLKIFGSYDVLSI
ncbi:prephenate dehydratase [Phormidesmis priestleyi ULC007]|uniref:Prephenate dehydratase n=1 Tax=Phormidesmis priestleyi ULC007 TaxID=1920490 RepID=A0A2T1DNZ9_9CYAN|nr:prephenate dehydratase [Phormidesmis priestleyi]PSB22209.1 prephenate dehydratase [Phormidesmis priestleyi ULC007]PZO52530.1 MAG: prephenate dehydratase [Phormidesmis priestleyi]